NGLPTLRAFAFCAKSADAEGACITRCTSSVAAPLLRLPIPVPQQPQVIVPTAQHRAQRPGLRRNARPENDRDDVAAADDELIEADEVRGALYGIELAFLHREDLVVVVAAPPRNVAALPLVRLRGDLGGDELLHERVRVRLRHGGGVHLHVAVELGVRVRVRDVGGEKYRRRDRLQLEVDSRLLARLLDDLLGLLSRRVDRGLVDELELLAVLRPDAIRTALPA